MVLISLLSVLNLLYFYISTFRSMCAVPNMAVFYSYYYYYYYFHYCNLDRSQSQRPCVLRHRSVAACLLGLRVQIPPGHWCLCDVRVMCCQIYHSSRGDLSSVVCLSRLIECGLPECDREASILRKPLSTRGCCLMERILILLQDLVVFT